MAPRFRPSGWAGRDALLVGTRQRVRGLNPRQLFVFAGSFSTIRRRRLASPASILEIEATHPHVNGVPRCVSVGAAPGTSYPGGPVSLGSGSEYLIPSIREGIVSRVASRQRSNPLALAVLACLVERPMHPYEMAATMRTRGHDESIKLNYGSLYTVVESLARRGLIEPREPERDGRRPERTVYTITDGGTHRVRRLAHRSARHAGEGVPAVRGRSHADGGLPPADVVPLLEERCKKLELELATALVDARRRDAVTACRACSSSRSSTSARCATRSSSSRASSPRDIASGALDGLDQWARSTRGDDSTSPKRQTVRRQREGEPMTPIVEVEGVERSFGDTTRALRHRPRGARRKRRRAARPERRGQDHARAHPVDVDPARRGDARGSRGSTW